MYQFWSTRATILRIARGASWDSLGIAPEQCDDHLLSALEGAEHVCHVLTVNNRTEETSSRAARFAVAARKCRALCSPITVSEEDKQAIMSLDNNKSVVVTDAKKVLADVESESKEQVYVDKDVLEAILGIATIGKGQVVEYSRDEHLMAARAAELSKQKCGDIEMSLLAILRKARFTLDDMSTLVDQSVPASGSEVTAWAATTDEIAETPLLAALEKLENYVDVSCWRMIQVAKQQHSMGSSAPQMCMMMENKRIK